MKTWVRLYTALPSNRKVQALPPILFKFWVNCLAFAGQNDGELPPISDMAWELRISEARVDRWIGELEKARLIDFEDGGAEDLRIYRMHNWAKRQYEESSSTERVRKFRERKSGVSETLPVTVTSVSGNELHSGYSRARSESVSVLSLKSVSGSAFPIPAEELETAWERHKAYSPKEPYQVVIQSILSMNGEFDVERFRERHEAYCEYWAAKGWTAFGVLTFWGWIQAKMPEALREVVKIRTGRRSGL